MLSTYVLLRDGRPVVTDHPRKLLLLSNPVGESDISQQLVAHSAAVCITSFQVPNPAEKTSDWGIAYLDAIEIWEVASELRLNT